jgi:hypothetical protein
VDNINIANDVSDIQEVAQSAYDVYPNPVNNDGEITVTNPGNEKIKLTMYDAKGSVVLKNYIFLSAKISLAPYKLAPGVYYLNMFGETRIMNYKVVVK